MFKVGGNHIKMLEDRGSLPTAPRLRRLNRLRCEVIDIAQKKLRVRNTVACFKLRVSIWLSLLGCLGLLSLNSEP